MQQRGCAMPIYEYACHDCRKIFQFFSKTMGTQKRPKCPQCGRRNLERLLSSFAPIGASKTRDKPSGGEEGEPGSEAGMDDPFAHMSPAQQAAAEREMMRLMSDAEGLDENDPRQLGHLMERMTQLTGMQDKAMLEAIRRLKAGEDPDKIEEDMGGELDFGEGGGAGPLGGYGHDPDIYDM
jgi:putative FmdB family regulatory protein